MYFYKINNDYSRDNRIGENDIYRKFHIEFESFFNPDDIAKTDSDFDEIYVHDYNFEKDLKNFFNSTVSMAKFCVGYTGIGKTTSIRYCLGLKTGKAPLINKKDKVIVFPTFLDGYRVEEMEKFNLSNRIASVCTQLEIEHPELRSHLQSDEGKKEFYKFMLKHNSFALENIDHVYAMDLPYDELVKYSLKTALEFDAFTYNANRLKFYLMKKNSCYNRLIILLDDIETLPQNYQRETIKKYLKLFDCMKNTDYNQESPFNVNLLISMRPHTHRFLYGDRDIETYPLANAILKREAVDLSLLFEKRFDFYSKKYRSRSTIGSIDSWEYCYNEIMRINKSIEGKYKSMIQNLCFFNLRESLTAYARVFSNRFWVQKNKARSDSFSIFSCEYIFNNVNVIRALACNEEAVYFGGKECLIPNIFYTTPQNDYSVHCLLIIQYFANRREGEDYGVNAQKLGEIKFELNNIFTSEYVKQFEFVIKYLFDKKVLRKSIYTKDDADAIESLDDNSELYISPLGNELFNMLSRDSVFFEMLRESSWRNYDNREYSNDPSIILTKSKDYN